MITHLFFDVGGVLGTNGWGKTQRAEAVEHFGLDKDEFDRRHKSVVTAFEQGKLSLDGYLDEVVFHRPRAFARDEFAVFMRQLSVASADVVALARSLARTGRFRVMTLNNESANLNAFRLKTFGLTEFCVAFFSSCWLGVSKPDPKIYEMALALSQAKGKESVFVDDREENLTPARALGMTGIRFTGAPALKAELAALGVTT